MIQKSMLAGILFCFCIFITNCIQKSSIPDLKGPYLGQKPPGTAPEIFAPGIISYGFHEHGLTMSPDYDEIFYAMSGGSYSLYRIINLKINKKGWTKPKTASFSSNYTDMAPFIAPEGYKLFFASVRPVPGRPDLDNITNIWAADKTENGWSDPKFLAGSINSETDETNPSVSLNGTLFFQRYEKDAGGWNLFYSKYSEGTYQEPVKLGPDINTENNESAPFISPDETYLLFHSNRPGGFGSMDIYICYKKEHRGWTAPVNLGPAVNSASSDWKPYVTPDGKYLFFSSYRNPEADSLQNKSYDELIQFYRKPANGYGTLYWIDAAIINSVKPK